MKRLRLFALFLLLYPLTGLAQTADVSGVVQDSSGASIPNASVEFRNQDTGIRLQAVTNESGYYHIPTIQPGKYDATVQAKGFQTLTQEGVLIQTDTARRVDYTLKVASDNSTVTVNADSGLLQMNNAQVETHITQDEYNKLPLLQLGRNRSPATFVYLAPGVSGNVSLNGTNYTGATNVIQMNGSQAYTTEILVDGFPGGQARIAGNFTESSPPPDAISEFKITTSALPAEYGHTGGGVGSFTVKSGTNEFHGTAYEYLRNSFLDAENWLAKHNNARVNSTKQNEFGATIGGPIILPHLYDGHDKTFFFFSYNGSRLAGPNSYTQTQIPTLDERNGLFTFTGGPTANAGLYDPGTTTESGAFYTRAKFPVYATTATTTTYQIPANRFDPVAQAVLKSYPTPNQSGTANYGGWGGNPLLNPDLYTAKLDHVINSANHLSATYIRTNVPRTTLSGLIAGPLGNDSYQVVASHTGRLHYDWTISPSLLNSAAFGFDRFTNLNLPLYGSSGYPQELGLNTPGYYYPTFTFTNGYTSVASTANGLNVENDFYYRDQMMWQLKNHAITFGGEYRRFVYNDTSPYKFSHSFGFSSLETGNPLSQSGSGDGFASFLLGQVDSGTVTAPWSVNAVKSYWGFFVQDDWQVTKRLVLNLGLREEWQPPAVEKHDRMSAVSLTAPNPEAGNLPGALIFAGPKPLGTGGRHLYHGDHSAIGPRFGFAYSVTPKSVVRGAYGIYYSDANYNGYTSVLTYGYQVKGTFTSPNNGVAPAFRLADGVPNTYPTTPNPNPSFINGQRGDYYDDLSAAMPRLQQWNLTIEQQITKNSSISATYIGTHSTREVNPYLHNINQVDSKYLALGSLLTQPANSAAAQEAGIKLPWAGFTGSVATALRPYPQYLEMDSVAGKFGASKYNAGSIVYQAKTRWGLMLHASYTFSKDMGYENGDVDGPGAPYNELQDAGNPKAEWSILPQDVRHAAVLFWTYALPFGPEQKYLTHGAAGKIAGGWTISAVQRYQSGTPMEVQMTNTLPLFNFVLRPNVIPGVSRSLHISNGKCNPSINCVFNKAAFAAPAPYTFGNGRPTYSDLRFYPVLYEDASLIKETELGEHLNWSLYLQALNVFNRHRFVGMSTNYSAATFGVPTAATDPRYIQLGTRFRF
ncbi:MAG TPA: carboxypeptidase-like regulatory domain-containing protein [Edaphobacter sp.]|nr:carboxypeptidase-like regulatory domain-containing protein [Edaphobacter sp.]